jgi:hypothetical protein
MQHHLSLEAHQVVLKQWRPLASFSYYSKTCLKRTLYETEFCLKRTYLVFSCPVTITVYLD